MKVLVTGAGGFVGTYLITQLLEDGHEVFATSTEISSKQKISEKLKWLKLDVTSLPEFSKIIAETKPDTVYHLAAISFLPQAEENFAEALKVNCCGTDNLFRALIANDCQSTRVVFISTSVVYGNFLPEDLPLTEETPCRPANNYAISKIAAEKVVERYARNFGFQTVIFRPLNHTGPLQADSFAIPSFAKQIAAIKLGLQEPVMKVGNIDSKVDFLDVRDVVSAYAQVVAKGTGLYTLGSGKAYSLREVIENLKSKNEVEVVIEIDPARFRPAQQAETRASSALFMKDFNWKAKYSFEDTLKDILDYWFEVLQNEKK